MTRKKKLKQNKSSARLYQTKSRLSIFSTLISFAIFGFCLIVIAGFLRDFFGVIRNYTEAIISKTPECPTYTKSVFYLIAFLITIAVSFYISIKTYKHIFPKIIIRDKQYILSLFKDRGNKSPQPTRENLIRFIYGKGKINKQTRNTISELIDEGVAPISQYLNKRNDENNILCINSKWGSGKTTALLIAINESEKSDNRYIYESAFKYSGNVGEFISDILKAINDVMVEVGIKKTKKLNSLINNVDDDPKVNLINFALNTAQNQNDLLSSDIILEINHQYQRSNIEAIVYVIIDDLDRLQGADVVRILSLLSILRNLVFIRIIVPADLDVVGLSLEKYGVIDAHRFIEKYLPIRPSIQLRSSYKYAEKITLDMLFRAQKGWAEDNDGAYPAFAAILIGMLAKKMRELTISFKNYRYNWLALNIYQQPIEVDNADEELKQLLRTPAILSSKANSSERIYNWDNRYNNIKKFQNIIYALTREGKSGNMPFRIKDAFTDNDYINTIDSWLFNYMDTQWELFGFTIRDILDELSSISYRQLPQKPAEQFIYVFNQFFPDEKLKYSNE